jgi:hypothetical protein
VSASFALNPYVVNASVSGDYGLANPENQNVNHGASSSITITPNEGYNIAGITDNDQTVTVSSPYVTNEVTAGHRPYRPKL